MIFRVICLLALLLPELPLEPFRSSLPCSWSHPLGTDSLGREGLLRLLHAGARSCGFASAVGLGAIAVGLAMALRPTCGARSALRSIPALLWVIPLAAVREGMGWLELGVLLAVLTGLHLEPPLRARLGPFRQGTAWRYGEVLGASRLHRIRAWAPWFLDQGAALLPSAWIGILWCEATIRALGLGPGPHRDSLGLILQEEIPRLVTDPTPLGWGALLVSLGLAAASKREHKETP